MAVAAGCRGAGEESRSADRRPGTTSPAPARPAATAATVPAGPTVTVAAAGDIACEPGRPVTPTRCRMMSTSDLLVGRDLDAVLTLGDNQYQDGTLDKFRRSYDRSWGRVKAITRPSPGNHEYVGGSAPGYFAYFGEAAGPPGKGWYSFDLGAWHLVALNSNCWAVRCGPGSEQHQWLVSDLAASRARCTLAYWHHPRFSSGIHGENLAVAPFWDALFAAGAEIVLNGHDHHYERFVPLTPAATIDRERGIRQLVVGTGGHSLYPAPFGLPGSERRDSRTYGVIVLTLQPDGYEARFMPEAGEKFTDSVTGRCR